MERLVERVRQAQALRYALGLELEFGRCHNFGVWGLAGL